MAQEITTTAKIRRLPWLIAANGINGVFFSLTVFGSFFVLFLRELGLDNTRIGFLVSLLPFAGVLAPFIGPLADRVGLRRLTLLSFGARTAVILFLLLTPWVLDHYSEDAAFKWVTVIILTFAVIRAAGMTALFPWSHEIVPDHIRGKISAINNISMNLGVAAAVSGASYVVRRFAGLTPFMAVIGVGVAAGFLTVLCFSFLPGGARRPRSAAGIGSFNAILEPLTDRNFRRYLSGVGVVMFTWTALFTFVPLYMKDQIGLSSADVLVLEVAGTVGGLLSSYLWGWAADRFGSRPIMLTGAALMCLLPVCWFLLPAHSDLSMPLAVALAVVVGGAVMGRMIGGNRYLFVTIVPPEKKTAYMAIWLAVFGLCGGSGPLLAGWFTDFCRGIDTEFLVFTIDAYTPLFGIGLALLLLGVVLLRRVSSDGAVSTGRFVRMFLQGNPLMAVESVMRYRMAGEETQRVHITERLGHAKNVMSVNELVDSLHDPSFNVRFEAVVAAAQLPANPELTSELIEVLSCGDPELSVAAAWALGKVGDESAVGPLRETARSEFVPLQAGSARALARLGDTSSTAFFLQQLKDQADPHVAIAYVAALGQLRAVEAIGVLVGFLRSCEDEMLRSEAALALARIIGHEHAYIRLWWGMRRDAGTTAARTLMSGRRRMARQYGGSEVSQLAQECADSFAGGDLNGAVERLVALLGSLHQAAPAEAAPLILAECADRLREFSAARIEYIALALHTMTVEGLAYRE